METQAMPVVTRKRTLFWCLALGFLGAHRFYLKQHFLGSLYLLFFWTLIPGVAALIDALLLALQDDAEFYEEMQERPLSGSEERAA